MDTIRLKLYQNCAEIPINNLIYDWKFHMQIFISIAMQNRIMFNLQYNEYTYICEVEDSNCFKYQITQEMLKDT
jgi:hypothetical protein